MHRHTGAHLLQFATCLNCNLLRWTSTFGARLLHFAHHIGATDHMTEYNVLPVQPIGSATDENPFKTGFPWNAKCANLLCCRDEELRSVCVGPWVGHGQWTEIAMLQNEVFVGEFFAVNGFASGSIVIGEIAALTHLQQIKYFYPLNSLYRQLRFALTKSGMMRWNVLPL